MPVAGEADNVVSALWNLVWIPVFSLRSPERTVVACVLPDKPKASSARGLADEEELFQKSMWVLKQCCDDRFVILFNPPVVSDKKSSIRRWSMGRFVTSSNDVDKNVWVNNSELYLAARVTRTLARRQRPSPLTFPGGGRITKGQKRQQASTMGAPAGSPRCIFLWSVYFLPPPSSRGRSFDARGSTSQGSVGIPRSPQNFSPPVEGGGLGMGHGLSAGLSA